MFWRLGTMLERFFEAKSFGLHISKPKHVPENTIFYVSKMSIMAMWLCIMAMYHGYVSWLCIMAMYRGYVSWLCILYYLYYVLYKNDSSESKKVNFWKVLKILFWYRIQNLRKILWRFAPKSLIFVHSASSYGRNKFCIEFRSQCMSYISLWE